MNRAMALRKYVHVPVITFEKPCKFTKKLLSANQTQTHFQTTFHLVLELEFWVKYKDKYYDYFRSTTPPLSRMPTAVLVRNRKLSKQHNQNFKS